MSYAVEENDWPSNSRKEIGKAHKNIVVRKFLTHIRLPSILIMPKNDGLVKSQSLDGNVKSSRCKARQS